MTTPPALNSLDRLVRRARGLADVARPLIVPLFAVQRSDVPGIEETSRPAAPKPAARTTAPARENAQQAAARKVSAPQEAVMAAREVDVATAPSAARDAPRAAAPPAPAPAPPKPPAAPNPAPTAPVKQRVPPLEQLFQKLEARVDSAARPVVPAARAQERVLPPAPPRQPVPQKSAAHAAQPEAAESVVRVTIGQIVVRAAQPAPAPAPVARAQRPGPTLEEYLARGVRP